MSILTLNPEFKDDDGNYIDITSCTLSDPTGTYGVKRNDTDAVVVVDGTVMTKVSAGRYTYSFTQPADDLTYTYWLEIVYLGETIHYERTVSGTGTNYRTSSTDVAAIIEVDSSIGLTPFIRAANQLVTELCADVSSYTSIRLKEIETWLAAHFYCVRDMRAESEKAGPVSEKKQSKVDLGFDTSHYGQMAMRLDTNGGLARLNEQIKKGTRVTPSISWLGLEEDEL